MKPDTALVQERASWPCAALAMHRAVAQKNWMPFEQVMVFVLNTTLCTRRSQFVDDLPMAW